MTTISTILLIEFLPQKLPYEVMGFLFPIKAVIEGDR